MGNKRPARFIDSNTVEIQLTLGKVAIVDATDFDLISGRTWQANARHDGKCFYAVSKGVRMHRLLMGAVGQEIVDHIDGDGLNNRRENLRIGTQSQNCVNRKTTPGKYLRGAYPKRGVWRSQIKHNGKITSLGYFKTEIEAHRAYLAAASAKHGDWMPLPPAPEEGE